MKVLVLIRNLILWLMSNILTGRQVTFHEHDKYFPRSASVLPDDCCLLTSNSKSRNAELPKYLAQH